jgi:hypothetical protein
MPQNRESAHVVQAGNKLIDGGAVGLSPQGTSDV